MTVNLQPVMFRRRLAAAATANRFFLASHVDVLEEDHPDRVFISLMCCYARDVLVGVSPGPYADETAELAVRAALIDDVDFAGHQQMTDATLAERYGVPLEQIA